MKKLYSILFKNDDLGNRARDLYFRTNDNLAVTYFNEKIIIPETTTVYFNTYFNSFSLDRWKKYTKLSSLFLTIKVEGSFTIIIKNRYLSGEDIVERIVSTTNIERVEKKEFTFEIKNIDNYEGMIYFEISSNEGKTILYDAYYGTEIKEEEKEISIALVICTFKREMYIERMLNKFEEERLDSSYKMFIIDNGKTLNYKNKENVFFFKNKNYGGAGGFTRGIIEAQRFNEKHSKKISHILLMDDDILFDFRVLERLKSFLELKEEDLNKLFSLSCKDTKEKSKLEKVTKDNFFDNILKIVERIEKNFWDDLNFDELYFIEKFTEEYEKTNKNFVDILKVFKECNLFMKNILSYNEELIIQIYIETENTDEIRKNLSSIYCIIELFKKIKKRDKDFPYIKASKVYKILKKNS